MRLSGSAAFGRVYAAKRRAGEGPLLAYTLPNGLTHCRLGFAVPRRVGTAVTRNRIKRLIREAFRLTQHDWPAGYDVVINVRPHAPLTLRGYQQALASIMTQSHRAWTKKQASTKSAEGAA